MGLDSRLTKFRYPTWSRSRHYHVVFTLPAPIADIAYQNKAVIYGLLFRNPCSCVAGVGRLEVGYPNQPRRVALEVIQVAKARRDVDECEQAALPVLQGVGGRGVDRKSVV